MDKGITVSELYDYPITLESVEFYNATGMDLNQEIDGQGEIKVKNFLNTIHSHVYDYLIYPTGRKDIKDRIIQAYSTELEKPIKRALVLQAKYLLQNGNIGLWNGIVNTVDGSGNVNAETILQKVLCPEVINLLIGTQPNILYAGG